MTLRDISPVGVKAEDRHAEFRTALAVGDALSRRWLAGADNPFSDEIAKIAGTAGGPGAYLLNLSYEWTCTTSAAADPGGTGNRLLRTLDWPLDGLGRHLKVLVGEKASRSRRRPKARRFEPPI